MQSNSQTEIKVDDAKNQVGETAGIRQKYVVNFV